MKLNKIKTFLIISLLVITTVQYTYSQDQDNKWVIGIGVNAVDFYPTSESSDITGNNGGFFSGITNAIDHWNVFLPTINISRHINNRFSTDAALSLNQIYKIGETRVSNLSYLGVDITGQYAFRDSSKKLIPFALAGVGYTWVDSKGWGTVNVGLGSNYWFHDRFGVKVNAVYKHSGEDKVVKLLSHFQYSMSIVLKLNSKGVSRAGNCPE